MIGIFERGHSPQPDDEELPTDAQQGKAGLHSQSKYAQILRGDKRNVKANLSGLEYEAYRQPQPANITKPVGLLEILVF